MTMSSKAEVRERVSRARRSVSGPGAPATASDGAGRRDRRGGRAVAVLLLVLGAVAWKVRRQQPASDEAADRGARRDEVLHYAIPRGQDPAAASAALRVQGYAVHLHEERVDYEIEIRAENGGYVDREHVRRILQGSSLDLGGGGSLDVPVRFTDEL